MATGTLGNAGYRMQDTEKLRLRNIPVRLRVPRPAEIPLQALSPISRREGLPFMKNRLTKSGRG